MSVKLFIPLADGQSIPCRSFKSICNQTIPTDIIPCVSKGVIESNREIIRLMNRPVKVHSEVTNRNKISEFINAFNITDEYVIMQDRDCEHLFNDNFERAIEFLNENKDYAATVLPIDRSFLMKNHIIIACVVFRTEFVRNFKFRAMPEMHTCESTRKDIIATGYKYDYLVHDKILVHELNQEEQ